MGVRRLAYAAWPVRHATMTTPAGHLNPPRHGIWQPADLTGCQTVCLGDWLGVRRRGEVAVLVGRGADGLLDDLVDEEAAVLLDEVDQGRRATFRIDRRIERGDDGADAAIL